MNYHSLLEFWKGNPQGGCVGIAGPRGIQKWILLGRLLHPRNLSAGTNRVKSTLWAESGQREARPGMGRGT